MPFLLGLAKSRLAHGTAVGFYGMGVQLLVQLVSVPILTHRWGLAGYGVWLILFSVPSFLAMADFGLTSAGANAMIDAVARGERDRAARIHSALRVITSAMAALVIAIAALVFFVFEPRALDFAQHLAAGEARSTAMLLCGYGVLAMINGVTLAGYRAVDAFALSGAVYQTTILIEAGAALAVAYAGGGPATVALTYFVARLAGSVVLSAGLHRRAPWLGGGGWLAARGDLKALIRPALAALVLPGANAVSLQGSVMVIGAIAGPSAVPTYALVRTLSRTALQFAYRFNVASMPRYTVFTAQGDRNRQDQLVVANLLVAGGLVLPAAIGLLVAGLPFIDLWSGGRVEPSLALLAIMVATMLVNAAWAPLSNLLLAVNRHGPYAWFFLLMSGVALGLGALLTARWGADGMAMAMLLLELAMTIRVWQLARRQGMVDGPALRRATRAVLADLQSRRSPGRETGRG